MAKLSIYMPDKLYAEAQDHVDGSFSRFISTCVDSYIDPFRRRCECGVVIMEKEWYYCPKCGKQVLH